MFSAVLVLIIMTIISFWYGISVDEIDMNNYGKAIQGFELLKQEKMEEAFEQFKEYNRVDPENEIVNRSYCVFFEAMGRPYEA